METLIKNIAEIQSVRTRDELASDGGGSGRSDSNDKMVS